MCALSERKMDPMTIADVKEIARKKLHSDVWDYYVTGADDEQSVRRNEAIYSKYLLCMHLVSMMY